MEKLGIKGWGGKSPNTVYAADIVRTRLKRTCMPTLPNYSFHLIEVLETSSRNTVSPIGLFAPYQSRYLVNCSTLNEFSS